MSGDEDYRPGPGRPPREYQFKKGKSGNPKGRPRSPLSLKTIVQQELETPITIAQTGEAVPLLQAAVRTLCHKALKGNMRALEKLFEQAETSLKQEDASTPELPEEDAAILRRHFGSKTEGD